MATIIEPDPTGQPITQVDRLSQISWGAVFAGLVFVVAISWLLFLLGTAIGVGIVDANDAKAMGDGLSIGAVVWMLATYLIAFFLGGLLAGRLAGRADKAVGMLHGITLWGVGTVLMILISYVGVSTLLQTGLTILKGTANAATSLVSGALQGASAVEGGAADLAKSPLMIDVQALVKRKAIEIISKSESKRGAEVSRSEVKQAMKEVDAETLQTVAGRLVAGDISGAKQALAAQTNLSQGQVKSVIDGLASEVDQRINFDELQRKLKQRTSEIIASFNSPTGATATPKEVAQAIEELNFQTLQTVAFQLVRGNTQSAKNVLVANTNLSEQEVNSIVDGVSAEVKERVARVQRELNNMIETTSDYTQAVLWAAFIGGAIGLVGCIFGGWIGASTVDRLYVVGASRQPSSR